MGVAGVAGVPAAVVVAEAVGKGGIQTEQRRGKGERGGNGARAAGAGPAPWERAVFISVPSCCSSGLRDLGRPSLLRTSSLTFKRRWGEWL